MTVSPYRETETLARPLTVALTEAQLQAAVIELAGWLRLLVYHVPDSRRAQPGWPDLALCGRHGFLLRELKTATGRPTREQRHWGERLTAAGIDWAIWRPADLASSRIRRELEAIR